MDGKIKKIRKTSKNCTEKIGRTEKLAIGIYVFKTYIYIFATSSPLKTFMTQIRNPFVTLNHNFANQTNKMRT